MKKLHIALLLGVLCILLCIPICACAASGEEGKVKYYAVAYTASEGGTIQGEKSQIVEEGGDGSPVLAVPSEGFVFVGWSDGLKTRERQEKEVGENLQLIAFFHAKDPEEQLPVEPQEPEVPDKPDTPDEPEVPDKPDEPDVPEEPDPQEPEEPEPQEPETVYYVVRYETDGNGWIDGKIEQRVKAGASCTPVRAIAQWGWEFEFWSDGVETEERQDNNINEDLTVTAYFRKIESAPQEPETKYYTVRYETDGYGWIEGETEQRVEAGTSCTPVRAVAQGGWEFDYWSDDVRAEIRHDKNIQEDMTLKAYFRETPEEDPTPQKPETKYYTVRYESGGYGWVKGNTEQRVKAGASCTPVKAIAINGYRFAGWSDGAETETRQDQNIQEDMTVTAYFTPIICTVRYETDGNGYIEGDAVQNVEMFSRSQFVTAVPKEGYEFFKWSDGLASYGRTDIIEKDITFTATFRKKTLTVRYYAKSGGEIEGQEVQKVLYGESTSPVKAVPDEYYRYRYHFLFWSDGLETEERQDKVITEDVTYYAQFGVFNDYTVDGGGKIVGNTHQKIVPGTEAEEVVAVPDEGYVFTGWSDLSLNPIHKVEALERCDWETKAYFEKVQMTFSYDYGGGDHAPTKASVTIDRNKLKEAKFVVPKRAGYTFCGWYADEKYDLKVVNEDGKLMLGYYTFALDIDTLYAKWKRDGEEESLPVYKVLLTMTDEIHASLYSSVSQKNELVDYKMTGFERKIFTEIYEWFKEILVDWFRGREIFEVDLFYTTEPIGTKENRVGDDVINAGMSAADTLDYRLFPDNIPQVWSMLGKYHSILNAYGFGYENENYLKYAAGEAHIKYGSVNIDKIFSALIVNQKVLLKIYEGVMSREISSNDYFDTTVGTFLHEFTHTVELNYGYNGIYGYHEALGGRNSFTATKQYLLHELEVDGELVGIPEAYWQHKEDVHVAYTPNTVNKKDGGKVVCETELKKALQGNFVNGYVSYGGTVTVEAIPLYGNRFVGWSDGVLTERRTDKNLISLLKVTAIFEKV